MTPTPFKVTSISAAGKKQLAKLNAAQSMAADQIARLTHCEAQVREGLTRGSSNNGFACELATQ